MNYLYFTSEAADVLSCVEESQVKGAAAAAKVNRFEQIVRTEDRIARREALHWH